MKHLSYTQKHECNKYEKNNERAQKELRMKFCWKQL